MIFYFSGTGNTHWAARHIAEATNDTLVDIAQTMSANPSESNLTFALNADERIGFCFPTHGWQPPGIVRQFLKRLRLSASGNHYCYALTTCGDSIGETMTIFAKDLNLQGLHLDSCFSLTMPESYVALPFMYTDTIENERRKRDKAAEDILIFEELIISRKAGVCNIVKGPTPWFFSYVVGAYFNKKMITDNKFTVDADTCVHCGLCAKVCPVGDISIAEGIPQWHHDGSCTSCLTCYHHCPRHAINYGKTTRKRGQYYFGRNDNIQ